MAGFRADFAKMYGGDDSTDEEEDPAATGAQCVPVGGQLEFESSSEFAEHCVW